MKPRDAKDWHLLDKSIDQALGALRADTPSVADCKQAMADLLGTALPYTNCNVTYSNPITQATQSYITSGKTASTYAFSMLLPSDFWSENGATMQQYLTGKMDRDKAADAIQTYWKNQK